MPPPWAVYFRRRDDRRRIRRPLMCGVEVEIVGLSDGPPSHASCVRSLLRLSSRGTRKLPGMEPTRMRHPLHFSCSCPFTHDGDVIGHTLGSGRRASWSATGRRNDPSIPVSLLKGHRAVFGGPVDNPRWTEPSRWSAVIPRLHGTGTTRT